MAYNYTNLHKLEKLFKLLNNLDLPRHTYLVSFKLDRVWYEHHLGDGTYSAGDTLPKF